MEYLKRLALFLASLALACASCTIPEEEESSPDNCATEEQREDMCDDIFTNAKESWKECGNTSKAQVDMLVILNQLKKRCLGYYTGPECIPTDSLKECVKWNWPCNADGTDLAISPTCMDTIEDNDQ